MTVAKTNLKIVFAGSADRTHFSAAICIDACGHRYPTHFCKHGESNVLLMPGTEIVNTPRGYYTDEAFETYIDFLLDSSKGGIPDDGVWRILVVDGYGSHTIVPSVLKKMLDRHIMCVCMPSHTSQVLQPLDVSCFRPTKYFWSWSLRYITGIGGICDVTMYQAPYYFEIALMNGCTLRTIENGFRTTGLYPFDENWPENNKEKFCMAETLDRDKLDAKLSAHNADLSFADSYKMFETRAAKIETHFEQAGENLQATFPDLHAAVKDYLDSKK